MGEARPKGEVVVYQGQDGALRIEAKVAGESIWLPMADMAKLFGVKAPAISKHVKNIYATRELSPRATVSKMETVRREGASLSESVRVRALSRIRGALVL